MREPGWDRGAYEAYGGYDAPPGAPRYDAPPSAPQSSDAGRRLDPTYAARPSPPIAPPGRPPGYAPAPPPPPPMPGAGLWPDMGLWGGALQPPPARPRGKHVLHPKSQRSPNHPRLYLMLKPNATVYHC